MRIIKDAGNRRATEGEAISKNVYLPKVLAFLWDLCG